MPVPAIRHIMIMIMRMRNSVRMRRSIVRMRESVLVLMYVMPYQSICHYERRPSEHYDQCNKVHP